MNDYSETGQISKKKSRREEEEQEEEEEEEEEVDDPQQRFEDSSEEEEEGSEEERAVREGFIADEDEEEEEEEQLEDRSARKRKRKHRHKHRHKERKKHRSETGDRDDDDDLDEDDLELLAENTGVTRFKSKRRLRRAGSVASDDIDQDNDALNRIFDDDDDESPTSPNLSRRRDGLGVDDELDDFIEEDEFPEESPTDPTSKLTKRKGKVVSLSQGDSGRQRQVGRLMGALAPDVSGISKESWQEVIEVFGNGEDYAWAFDPEENEDLTLDQNPGDPDRDESQLNSTLVQLKDIFEPSEIKDRMLTEADEAIRLLDVPERVQLASTALANANPGEPLLSTEELEIAAEWVAPRISARCSQEFLQKDRQGFSPLMKGHFLIAVKDVLDLFLSQYFEVPFVFMHRQDYITYHEPRRSDAPEKSVQFFTRDELWKAHALALKYIALLERKRGLKRLFDKLSVKDSYFEECFQQIQSVEEVSDLMQWLTLEYGHRIREAQADVREDADALAAGFEREDAKKAVRYKKALRDSKYERAKGTSVKSIAQEIGISARNLSEHYLAHSREQFINDPPSAPLSYAQRFSDEDTEFDDPKKVLEAAKLIVSTDIGRDPVLKKHMRELFQRHGVVTVTPTEAGLLKINELHPYFAFKYLSQKPFSALKHSSQYLQIMAAELELLVNVQVHLHPEADHNFKKDLVETYKSDLTSEIATKWNDLREEVLMHAIEHMLLPDAARWAKNYLKDEAEEFVAQKCAEELEFRLDVAPYHPPHLFEGEVPSVVAISNGSGDPKRDSVFVVYLDQVGRFRDHMKLDNLRDPEPRQDLALLLRKRAPDVIVVGGFNTFTFRLLGDVKTVTGELSERIRTELQQGDSNDKALNRHSFPVIVARDDTARLSQQSKRAEEEFGELPPLGRYCVALARYVQSPLNEYAAAGSDLTAIPFHPDQQFLPKETLQTYLDRALANIVNAVGVDINRAVNDPYYQHLLQYVCGLGPRKAQKLVKLINTNPNIEGTLGLRNELVTENLATKNIFYNCSGFLRIRQHDNHRANTDPDVLDDTRIHPEDYHIACKMAADAQELDEEDLAGQPISQVVSELMAADGGSGVAKLEDLNLDDFAEELNRLMGVRKRLTLYQIRSEMQNPYAEKRNKFEALTAEQMFDIWTGENEATLSQGAVIPVKIIKVRDRGLAVRLDSGIEGFIDKTYMVDEGTPDMSKFPPGSTIQALVMEIHKDRFLVELNSQPSSVGVGATYRKKVETDRYFDIAQMEMDKDRIENKKKGGSRRTQRVIKHPAFHNFNSGQAEQHLANLQRGDCVIRPSSRGTDHLAVTWKVDTGVYQHIDVLELDKPNEFSLGRILKIGGKYSYSDLDELIVSHVRAMARKVEEMIAHEKYKGSYDEMSNFLKTYLMANPEKSVYAFCINKESAGNFYLGFKADKNSQLQTWNVKVTPGAFELHGTQAGDMLSLCNVFKTQHTARAAIAPMGNPGNRSELHGRHTPALSGRTPIQGGRTPMLSNRTPILGSRTPLVTPRYPGSTPQYQQPSTPAINSYGLQAPPRQIPQPPPPPVGANSAGFFFFS
ncbi:SH2 domain-containing protein [Phakopsora pachyrhizi]|nr:SH2 domain-containing protein [Phakopsora pachyrhizi]